MVLIRIQGQMMEVLEMSRLDDVTPQGYGIFEALQALDVPWKTLDVSAALDLEYYGNVSGDKNISPLVNRLLGDSTNLSVNDVDDIAEILFTMFGVNWGKQWETLSLEYSPIANYDMTEIMTDDTTEREYENTSGTDNKVYGFNSSTPVPSDETDSGISGSESNVRNYELHRTGNIGVTTSQQLIESERNLWIWNFFNDVVFPDIDRVLTIQMY